MPQDYIAPIAKLLTYGELELRHSNRPWPDYLKLGFVEEHVPELIRMAIDDNLNNAKQDSLEVWAPVHAWRVLGQLRAVEATEPLVRLFGTLDHDDWTSSELPKVFSLIGPSSIPIIAEFLADSSVDEIARISTPICLERVVLDHPESRDKVIDVLAHQLGTYTTNGPALNAFIIGSLTTLKATEAIDVTRKAFFSECVDLTVLGDIEDVEIEMGLRLTRETPPPDMQLFRSLPSLKPNDSMKNGLDDFNADTIKNPFSNVGRNDPCPCGSGKKFKKCCLH